MASNSPQPSLISPRPSVAASDSGGSREPSLSQQVVTSTSAKIQTPDQAQHQTTAQTPGESQTSHAEPPASIPDHKTSNHIHNSHSSKASLVLSSSSSASASNSSIVTRKSGFAEAGTTDTNADPATLSRPLISPRASLAESRSPSTVSDVWSEDPSPYSKSLDDFETPRLSAGSSNPLDATRSAYLPQLPEPALYPSRASIELSQKRMSASSFLSYSSGGRGLASSAVSEKGSDGSGTPSSILRAVTGLMSQAPGKGPRGSDAAAPPQSSSEAELSNVTVTTTSMGAGMTHQLAPRESTNPPMNELTKVNSNSTTTTQKTDVTTGGQPRPQPPTRSRSRAKRRFSGSTANSSHSPSSDRMQQKRTKEEKKPAPFGTLGICALEIKSRSKPSRNILGRLVANKEFDLEIFGDKVILDEKVEDWPICDYLICFYSDGFPLDKAIAYVKARKPFCVNDVPMQKILWDRRICLRLLDTIGVRTPQRLEVNRDGGPKFFNAEFAKYVKDAAGVALEACDPAKYPPPKTIEMLDDDDIISVDGKVLRKPFVEKPTSGEDHNITIYYPKSAGGGARRLFRKIGNKSSEWVEDLNTPRALTNPSGSYIYEEFMRVDDQEDVKAYTVGSKYCHCETRKSPVVDGVVRRNTHGKEIRYITPLSPEEKEIARKIPTAFGQRVCGFDLLRANGKSYVIDVNGWSFVKENNEYYDNTAAILREMFLNEWRRRNPITSPLPSPAPSAKDVDPMSRQGTLKDKEAFTAAMLANQARTNSNSTVILANPNSKSPKGGSSQPATSGITSPKSESALASKGSDDMISPMPRITDGMVNSGPATAAPTVPATPNLPESMMDEAQETPPPPPPKHSWKLKGVVSVLRHADRTPKQKYKFTFHSEPFVELLKGHTEEVLLIGEAALASVANAVDEAMQQDIEDKSKLISLRNVLIKKGNWPGTKVQIKPMFRKKKDDDVEMPTLEEKKVAETPKGGSGGFNDEIDDVTGEYKPRIPPKRHDSLSGVTMSKFTAAENSLVLDKLQLIVKWGGEPTHSARYQSQELGENMRNDFLLLNRHIFDDCQVFSSSERRVHTSAQIWAASFLGQKELPEDFIVTRKDLLDDSNAAKDEMDKVKKKLKGLLRKGNERPPQFAWPDNMPEPSEVQTRVVQLMIFHRRVMQYNYGKLQGGAANSLAAIASSSAEKLHLHNHRHHLAGAGGDGSANGSGADMSSSSGGSLAQANAVNNIQARWCCQEDAELFRERWEKLFAEFCDGEKVDPSKISELYDTMKFDALHNRAFLEWVFTPPKHMLEEEYGVSVSTSGNKQPKEGSSSTGGADESKEGGKPDDARSTKSFQTATTADENSSNGKDAKSEKPPANAGATARRRKWATRLNRFYHGPETSADYFHLHKGNSQTKAKTDARFEPLRELYQLAKVLFDFICPQEYGISDSEKLEIGLLTSLPLLKEIVQDLEEMQASDDSKSFFYFTKESHIYTLLNCILEGGIETKIQRPTIPELDYLSQISFELYESETKPPAPPISASTPAIPTTTAEGSTALAPTDGEGQLLPPPAEEQQREPTYEYSIRISISPGCHITDPLDVQLDSRHCISCAQRRSLTPHGNWKAVIETLRAKFHQVKLPKTFLAVNLSDAFDFQEKTEGEDGKGGGEGDGEGDGEGEEGLEMKRRSKGEERD